jgi:hypothetical protein
MSLHSGALGLRFASFPIASLPSQSPSTSSGQVPPLEGEAELSSQWGELEGEKTSVRSYFQIRIAPDYKHPHSARRLLFARLLGTIS